MTRTTVATEISRAHPRPADSTHPPQRSRIIEAAFGLLIERGYAGASTREIARRARVSKRELYELFGNKQGILAAMISGRTARMRSPLALSAVRDRGELAETLARFAVTLMQEVCHPAVIELFRLAIIEAERSPELARALDEDGRQANRAALAAFFADAHSLGLVAGSTPERMAAQFLALLWEDLLTTLLLRRAEPPAPAEIERRAREAAKTLLTLYPAAPAAPGSRLSSAR
jgi:AcrR family transcriptional regulator